MNFRKYVDNREITNNSYYHTMSMDYCSSIALHGTTDRYCTLSCTTQTFIHL